MRWERVVNVTWYSVLNSCSIKLSRRSSHDSSKAVRMGSLEERAISDGEARARYALIRDLECRKESSCRDVTHSLQPHLRKKYTHVSNRPANLSDEYLYSGHFTHPSGVSIPADLFH